MLRQWTAAMTALMLSSLQISSALDFTPSSSFFFFTNQSESFFPTVSAECNKALTAPVYYCARQLLEMMGQNDFSTIGNDTIMDALCSKDCPGAFSSYRTNVTSACANQPQPVDGYPATYWVDATSAVFDQTCLKDTKTGAYCTDFFNTNLGDAVSPEALLGGYSKDVLCSSCIQSLFRSQQATPYSNYDSDSAAAWAAIQSQCGWSYPTATATLQTNVTSLGNYAPAGYPTASCLSQRFYKVVSGDTCSSIAVSQQVSTGAIPILNSLFPDCSNLQAGASLCLPLACTTYIVQSDDTCAGIAGKYNVDFQQIIAWNPSIDSYCLNLISDQAICVGPPGGPANFTAIPGATVTKTAIYATTTVARPTPVASGTTSKCGKYYQVQNGDYCQLVAVNATISLTLFEAINPSIDQQCSNLQAGVYYCVLPTADWNVTATSTVVTAPTTTPAGTTSNCYQYYVIQSGDYCAKVEDQFGITFAQLQAWNPSLLNDCSNLALGEAYCVNGGTSASTTSTGATSKVRRDELPIQTATLVGGGVPYGWPGLQHMRAMKQIGVHGYDGL